ncbi:MAG: NYN domain-containing protein [Planctomycetes bacterium]|nr:NYN domain-containing protein [Planctomycetota bacterium]
MMLVIDGYNFLYAVFGLERSLPIKDYEAARNRLHEYLSRYQNITHRQVIVVYDARGAAQRPNETFAGIHIICAPPRSNADDYIVKCVQNSPRPARLTVVTTDRELGERVKTAGGRVVRCGAFYKEMIDAFERGANPPDDRAHEKPTRPDPEEIDYFLREFGEDS